MRDIVCLSGACNLRNEDKGMGGRTNMREEGRKREWGEWYYMYVNSQFVMAISIVWIQIKINSLMAKVVKKKNL